MPQHRAEGTGVANKGFDLSELNPIHGLEPNSIVRPELGAVVKGSVLARDVRESNAPVCQNEFSVPGRDRWIEQEDRGVGGSSDRDETLPGPAHRTSGSERDDRVMRSGKFSEHLGLIVFVVGVARRVNRGDFRGDERTRDDKLGDGILAEDGPLERRRELMRRVSGRPNDEHKRPQRAHLGDSGPQQAFDDAPRSDAQGRQQ